jgi:NADPH:quinone reductase-like Zn-dependent oxidoreductase
MYKPNGRWADTAPARRRRSRRQRHHLTRPAVGRARAPLEQIVQLVVAGAVRSPEVKLYRLAQAAEAHRLSEARHFCGKLVFQVR